MISEETIYQAWKYIIEYGDGCLKGHKIMSALKRDELRWLRTPASTKYHCCFPGGLVFHTANVLRRLSWLSTVNQGCAEAFDNLHDISSKAKALDARTIFKVAVMHDAGKLGVPDGEDMYVLKPDGVGEFMYNKNIILPHQDLSIMWCQHYQQELSQAEFQAILYHNGLYCDNYKQIMRNQHELTILLHHADMQACNIDEVGF